MPARQWSRASPWSKSKLPKHPKSSSRPQEGAWAATIARRMHDSLQRTAQLTLHGEIDAAALVATREELRRRQELDRVGYNDIIMHAVAHVLPHHPRLNATLEEDIISIWESINLGVAISVTDGLMVGVVRDCQERSLISLMTEVRRVSEAARAGRIAMADVLGGTFTVSNLGSFGVDFFTPIVNPPQVAILGIGRIRPSGVLGASLTIDHRAVDGAPGGEFLSDFRSLLEDPARLLALSA
jgi:pyruvate dehydrogenase E2 component (dihydrolipoamide acetyltransferase)